MKRHVLVVVAIAIVLVVSLVLFLRSKETYVLPNPTAGSDEEICPLGFVLMCVSKELEDIITDVIPFPDSLPQPCEDTHIPLCLPGPEHTKPAYSKK
jgi:hypothetical protein